MLLRGILVLPWKIVLFMALIPRQDEIFCRLDEILCRLDDLIFEYAFPFSASVDAKGIMCIKVLPVVVHLLRGTFGIIVVQKVLG